MADLADLLARRAVFGMRLGLERMHLLLRLLDEPQRSFRAIHVVGTNGKTSTTRFAQAMLSAQGLVAAAYTSPHVTGFGERVAVDGRPAPDDVLAAAVASVEEAAAQVDRMSDQPLTQFEVLTAAAFVAFRAAAVEAAVIEAGLGGRHDATNVLAAPVVALTNVGIDHVEQLGSTRAAIAAEKLAVVVAGADLVAGDADAEIAPVISTLASHAGSITLLPPGADVADAPPLAAAGRFQRANLALALAACERFCGDGFDRPAALAAAATVVVPGRLQIVGLDPLVVLDGAHNPHGAAALAAEVADLAAGRAVVGVIATLSDKDVAGVLDAIAPVLTSAVATTSASPRALAPAELAAALRARGVETTVEPSAARALERARSAAGQHGVVLVCGSLTLLEDLADAVHLTGAR